MSTFTNYLKVYCPLDGFFILEIKQPVIQQSHMYLLIHWLVKVRIHMGDHIPVICFSVMSRSSNMGLYKCESTFPI